MKKLMYIVVASMFLAAPFQVQGKGFKKFLSKCCKTAAANYCKKVVKKQMRRIKFKSKAAAKKFAKKAFKKCFKKAYKKCLSKKHKKCLLVSSRKASALTSSSNSGSTNRIKCSCRGLGTDFNSNATYCANGQSCRQCCRADGWQDGRPYN